ncbi:MAG: VWA domain-containing protein [Chloroflexota bacterium]
MAGLGTVAHLGRRSRRGITLAWIALFALSLLLQSAAALSPAAALGAQEGVCGVTPLDIEIIIDNSSSMNTNSPSRLTRAKTAATKLVNDLDANGGIGAGGLHRVAITTFGGTTANALATPPDARWSSSAANLATAIASITTSVGTPLKAGILAGALDLVTNSRPAPARHILVVISDGKPHPSATQTPSAGDVATYLASADEAFSIGIDLNTALMASLATDPDHYFPLTAASQLPAAFEAIYQKIACPGIGLEKAASPTTYKVAGDVITYTYVVSNTGNEDLAGPVTVTDDKATVTCPAGDLLIDGSMTCTASYVITPADVEARSVTNIAQAHAGGIDSNLASATVTLAPTQSVLTETTPPTLPPTDALNSDAGSSTPGFGLMLALLVLAGIGMVTGQRASSPRRLRREEIRRR